MNMNRRQSLCVFLAVVVALLAAGLRGQSSATLPTSPPSSRPADPLEGATIDVNLGDATFRYQLLQLAEHAPGAGGATTTRPATQPAEAPAPPAPPPFAISAVRGMAPFVVHVHAVNVPLAGDRVAARYEW